MAMPFDPQQQMAAFLDIWLGEMGDDSPVFDDAKLATLGADHCFSEDLLPPLWLVLETAAQAYRQEEKRAARDSSKHRKQLDRLEKAATKLAAVLDDLDPDTQSVLHEARIARGFKDHGVVEIVTATLQSMADADAEPDQEPSQHLDQPSTLEALRHLLSTVIDEANAGKRLSGRGKAGRPSDDCAIDLMQACFMIWTDMLKRKFTVGWYNGQPDSDAARFCADVAAIVDPNLSASRLISATRRVRESGIGIKDLQKLIAEFEEFRKR